MRVSISDARRRLPELVRRVKTEPGTSVQITVRDEVVAELRSVQPEPSPGAAAKALLAVMRRLPRPRGRKTRVSTAVKRHLYGSGR